MYSEFVINLFKRYRELQMEYYIYRKQESICDDKKRFDQLNKLMNKVADEQELICKLIYMETGKSLISRDFGIYDELVEICKARVAEAENKKIKRAEYMREYRKRKKENK